MNDVLGMRGFQGRCKLTALSEDSVDIEQFAMPLAAGRGLDDLLQVAPRNKSHRDVGATFVFTGVVNRNDVGMSDSCGGLGLAAKPLLGSRRGKRLWTHDFQGAEPVELGLLGEIDNPHAGRDPKRG